MKTGNMVAITHKAEQETERVKLESLNTSLTSAYQGAPTGVFRRRNHPSRVPFF